MTTNQDILSFLRVDKEAKEKEKEQEKEAHAKEKEEDRQLRATERQEDMEHILAMIQRGVQKEVRAAIQPVEERLEIQEKVNQELTKQFNSVIKEMEHLKKAVNNQQEFPVLPLPLQHYNQGGFQGIWSTARGREVGGRRPEVEDDYTVRKQEMCAPARRVVGFTPIEPRMIELQIQSYGAKDTEEAKIMEIKSYLKCEMKMKPSDIDKLDIVKIFPPAKENWNVLYVEFGSDYQVDMLFSHTRNMVKQDHSPQVGQVVSQADV